MKEDYALDTYADVFTVTLGHADPALGVDDLALEVGAGDDIAVDAGVRDVAFFPPMTGIYRACSRARSCAARILPTRCSQASSTRTKTMHRR